MRNIFQSVPRNAVMLMVDSVDHVTGKTGLTLTIELSKDGGAFAAITPVVTEIAYGFYKIALTASHTDTEGVMVMHVTAPGADPADFIISVGGIPVDVIKINSLTIIGDGSATPFHV